MRLPDATLSIFSCSNTLRFIAKRRANRLPALLRLCAVPSVCPLVAPRFGNVTEKAFSLSGEQLRNETNRPQAYVSAIPGRCCRSLQANVEAFWRSSFIASRRARSRAARCRFGLRFDENLADRLETSGVARLQCYRSNDLRWVAEFVRNGLGCAVVRVRQR